MSRVLWTVWLAGVTDSDNYYKSTTVRFLPTDVVATIAVSAFRAELPARDNLIRPEVDAWITEAIPADQWGSHRYGSSNSRWADGISELTFNIRVSRAATAATGIVHDRRDSVSSTRAAQVLERALVDRDTGAIHRLHTDITLEGATPVDVEALEAVLVRGTRLSVVGAEPLSDEAGVLAPRYDPDRDRVVFEPPPARGA
ncbi:hypothetical protein J1G43_01540 [Cellulomonas sp. zg-ZUI22]|uniref:hypothetical protein n=1 Tax=Cellulomonas sp. zg-ZUI22 TaxID=2816955 RepID=UPI001A94B1B8|nr:hypothetical protein [Cellulomonas sp. zg-ZUI22]MBO0898647.1 hypothetical protein [Cellulomonas sp. zg-ZUI22]